jgi:hypothetical protein
VTISKAAQAQRDEEKREAIKQLRKLIKPGQRVYTSLSKVSSSGMSRHISVLIPTKGRDNQPSIQNISYLVARATGLKFADGALQVGGAGMDMGFHVVYTLSRAMFPKGYHCTGSNGYDESPSEANGWEGKRSRAPRCNANDHFNDHTLAYDKKIVHRDGGYALHHEWI